MASQNTEDTAVEEESPTVLELWRLGCFLDLGFPPSMADALVVARVDWHEADRVLRKQPPGGFVWAFNYLMP